MLTDRCTIALYAAATMHAVCGFGVAHYPRACYQLMHMSTNKRMHRGTYENGQGPPSPALITCCRASASSLSPSSLMRSLNSALRLLTLLAPCRVSDPRAGDQRSGGQRKHHYW
jgi:hypothetical protein